LDLISLHSASAHTAMHCRSFRDDDILKCPEQFCSFWFCEPAPRRATLPKDSNGIVELCIQICEYNGLFCTFLCFAITALVLRWLRPLKLMAAISPMKLGACWIGDGIFEAFPWPVLLHARHHCPPPLGGGFWLFPFTASRLRLTDMVTTLSMEV